MDREVDRNANDDTEDHLKAAASNHQLVRNHWCKCLDQNDICYFRSPRTGYHGWMCCRCHGVVQTG